jgi:hypothetical protein
VVKKLTHFLSPGLVKLKMWDPVQSLLTCQKSSDKIKAHRPWVIGTAVQNNPSVRVSSLACAELVNLTMTRAPKPGTGGIVVPFTDCSIFQTEIEGCVHAVRSSQTQFQGNGLERVR